MFVGSSEDGRFTHYGQVWRLFEWDLGSNWTHRTWVGLVQLVLRSCPGFLLGIIVAKYAVWGTSCPQVFFLNSLVIRSSLFIKPLFCCLNLPSNTFLIHVYCILIHIYLILFILIPFHTNVVHSFQTYEINIRLYCSIFLPQWTYTFIIKYFSNANSEKLICQSIMIYRFFIDAWYVAH